MNPLYYYARQSRHLTIISLFNLSYYLFAFFAVFSKTSPHLAPPIESQNKGIIDKWISKIRYP